MVVFDPARGADENAAEMDEAIAAVATGEVTVASRDVELDGLAVRKGAWLGLAEGEPVAGGEDFDEVAGAVVERLLAEPRGVLTLLTGEDEPPLDGLLARDRRGIRISRSTCKRAASRTTRCSCRQNRSGGEPPIRVVLVEDNQVFREALELLLGLRERRRGRASVGDGSEAVARLHAKRRTSC